jgi:hypothetical protein
MGDRMARCQLNDLDTSGVQERVGANEKRVRPLAQKRCKVRIDLSAAAGGEDQDL